MYTQLLTRDPFYLLGFNEAQYIDSMNMANIGWSVDSETYTRVCNYDYPTVFNNYGFLYDHATNEYTSLYGDDKWRLYCDGGATALKVASSIGLIVVASL